MSRPARFAFVVHALTPMHRRLMGVAMGRPGLAVGLRSGLDPSQAGRICRFELEGVAEGWVLGVPLLPEELLGVAELVELPGAHLAELFPEDAQFS